MKKLIDSVRHLASRHTDAYPTHRHRIYGGGWFDPVKAELFTDLYREDARDYQALYYTASGKWILNTYSQPDRYLQVTTRFAEAWLRNRGYLRGGV